MYIFNLKNQCENTTILYDSNTEMLDKAKWEKKISTRYTFQNEKFPQKAFF